ncbi:MAG: 2-C-methyl-D-erythritol 4-phosphate cytidylyltransferase [Blastocatellia bacterium]
MNTAIIVAAGSGTRFGSDIPKQFVEILGKPVMIHALERFQACDTIDSIVLVVATDEVERTQELLEKYPCSKLARITSGGRTRAESVYNGLNNIDPATVIVAVHDGARPLVSTDEITQTIEKAMEFDAACLVAPVTDTIKEIDGQMIIGTIDRRNLRRALTPQAFRIELLDEAFAGGNFDEAVTDESYLVEKLGHAIAYVAGSPKNIKITHPEDVLIAEEYLLTYNKSK